MSTQWHTQPGSRYAGAFVASLCINALLWGLVARDLERMPAALARAPESPRLQVQVRPETPEPPVRQLVEVNTPAEAPDVPTDRIAVESARAADMADSQGDTGQPKVDTPSGFDDLGAPPPRPAPPSAPQPQPPAQPESPPRANEAPANPTARTEVAMRVPEPLRPQPKAEPTPNRAEPPAPAAPLPEPAPDRPPSPSRGRVDGGVKNTGVLNFEALKDEIAPYLAHIKARVEKQWTAALMVKYTGTSPTEAVVDCVINQAGEVVSVEVVRPGETPVFASICRESIQNAGPFGPFPFEVPSIYRDPNLEIRWTFSFLR